MVYWIWRDADEESESEEEGSEEEDSEEEDSDEEDGDEEVGDEAGDEIEDSERDALDEAEDDIHRTRRLPIHPMPTSPADGRAPPRTLHPSTAICQRHTVRRPPGILDLHLFSYNEVKWYTFSARSVDK